MVPERFREGVEACLGSLLCLERDVERRIRKMRYLMGDESVRAAAAVVAVATQAQAIAGLCGALAERPVECLLEEADAFFANRTSSR